MSLEVALLDRAISTSFLKSLCKELSESMVGSSGIQFFTRLYSGEQWTGSFYNIYWKFTWHIGPLYIFVLNCFGQCSYRYYVKTNTSCNYLVVVITKNAGYLFFLLKISEFFMSQFADKRTAKCGPESYVLSIPMSMELWKCCHLLLHASFVIWPLYIQHLFIHWKKNSIYFWKIHT